MSLSTQRAPRHTLPEIARKRTEAASELPVHRLGEGGLDSETAYELISSELLLDGQARLNLATFVTTYMPSVAARLMADTADKNIIDKDEYPQTAEIESRCVNILADFWNSPESRTEPPAARPRARARPAMLGGLALKWRWRERMRQAGKPTDPRGTLVMGVNVQVCGQVLPLLGRGGAAGSDGG